MVQKKLFFISPTFSFSLMAVLLIQHNTPQYEWYLESTSQTGLVDRLSLRRLVDSTVGMFEHYHCPRGKKKKKRPVSWEERVTQVCTFLSGR